MSSKFKPLHDRIKFTPVFESSVKSSIIDTSLSEKVIVGGIVVEVGDGVEEVQVGDHIKFNGKGSSFNTEDGVEYGYIIERDIFVLIKDTSDESTQG